MESIKIMNCWICNSSARYLHEPTFVLQSELTSDQFKISDSDYGRSLPRYRCSVCGFIQCMTPSNMVSFYENMNDEEYELGEQSRRKQFQDLINAMNIPLGAKWLDVGCGSGILVEVASELGYEACGLDPSWELIQSGMSRGRTIFCGTLDDNKLQLASYDVITIIDVIEHVDKPMELLQNARKYLAPGGILCISTPDAGSVFAKALRSKWWHVRIAHIGYFNKSNLELILNLAGFRSFKWFRPNWYFESEYLFSRLSRYVPILPKKILVTFFRKQNIKVNLRDSWTVMSRLK